MSTITLPPLDAVIKIWNTEWTCMHCHETATLFNSIGRSECNRIHLFDLARIDTVGRSRYYYPCCNKQQWHGGCMVGDHMPNFEWIETHIPRDSNIIKPEQIAVPVEFLSKERLKSAIPESRIIFMNPVIDQTSKALDIEKSYYLVKTRISPPTRYCSPLSKDVK